MKEYKALMFGHVFVESTFLNQGIYEATKPHLYSKDTTIESLCDTAKSLIQNTGVSTLFSPTYFENLRKCELVDVELIIKKQE